MRRRAVPLALVLLAAAPAAARAQDALPAVGAGGYNDAPLLAPGRYRDTLRPGERLFYAFELKTGQRLHVRAVVEGEGPRIDGADAFAVGIETPLREVETSPAVEDISGNSTVVLAPNEPIEFRTHAAIPFAATQGVGESGGYRGPGTYFVSLDLQSSNPQPIEVPVDFEVAVEGAAQPERPERTPVPTASATPARVPEREGAWAAGLVFAALAGLLLGLALAAARRLGRRRGRA